MDSLTADVLAETISFYTPEELEYLLSHIGLISHYVEKIYGTLMIGFSIMLSIFILMMIYSSLKQFAR